jgi:hypothetical protein
MAVQEPGYYRDILLRILRENDEEDRMLDQRKIERQIRHVVNLMKPHVPELIHQMQNLLSEMNNNPNNFLDKSALDRYGMWTGETDPSPPDPEEDLDDLKDTYNKLITKLKTTDLTIDILYDILESSRYYEETLDFDDRNVIDVFNRVLGQELTNSITRGHLSK